MRQVLQSLKTGKTEVADIPCPAVGSGEVLIRTTRTLVSSGTERMLVDFGKAGWIGKARQQPERVRQVLDKVRTDGLVPTIETVLNKLDQPLALGYCNVGVVERVGAAVAGMSPGDRVISNGKHAEAVSVPANLCARVPDGVGDEEAVFTVLAAIALQGIRLAAPTLGESVVVTGLGLVGLLTVQLLRAQGCRVLGLDFDPAKLRLAETFGAQTVDLSAGTDPVAAAQAFSRGRGVDAVLLTASTKSSDPVHQAAQMCRQRGRIVLVGVTGLELQRADFYEKELTFQVSCSYGPGRYDPAYEQKGLDYPIGFVRWTEQRNFEAVLDMLAERRIDVTPLVSHRFPVAEAERAYALVSGGEPSLGILLTYPEPEALPAPALSRQSVPLAVPARTGPVVLAAIGAGNYASGVLLPAFAATSARLHTVVSKGGVSGVHAGRKFGFEQASTDIDAVLADPAITAVVVATRHDSHAGLVCRALDAGKHVFVEKPLALSRAEIGQVRAALDAAGARGGAPVLTVGFNRRRAPHVVRMAELLKGVPGPKSFVMTVNAGAVPAGHWVHDAEAGGGRIAGEACHFIDLVRHLAGAPITGHAGHVLQGAADTATLELSFADGSIGTIHYFANGHKSFPKERLEVFASGRILQLDNFRVLRGYGWPAFSRQRLWRQDKGQTAFARTFVAAAEGAAAPPVPLDELFEVAEVTVDLAGELA